MKLLRNVLIVCAIMLLVFISGCGSKTVIDYGNAEAFEAALNNGDNLEGKTVQFVADEMHPDSAYGYNIWAGEHLNFVSERNPDVKAGDMVVVRATTIKSVLGSWIIEYEKVENAEIRDSTITTAGTVNANSTEALNGATEDNADEQLATQENVDTPEAIAEEQEVNPENNENTDDADDTLAEVVEESEPEAPVVLIPEESCLELVDYGWYLESSFGGTSYYQFCGMIHNTSDTLSAEFPRLIVTVRNGDGTIAATEEQVGSIVLPGDTVTLVGFFDMPTVGITGDAQLEMDLECDSMVQGSSLYSNIRSTDYVISNISERPGDFSTTFTGEITNNSAEDANMVQLALILRKAGEIVYISVDYLDNLGAGKTKAFEMELIDDAPPHDTIEISGLTW